MKDLFIKNCKILVKDLKMKQTNGNTFHIIGLEELITEISILFKTTYRFNVVLIKILMTFFIVSEQIILRLYEITKDLDSKTILRQKNNGGGIILPDFR